MFTTAAAGGRNARVLALCQGLYTCAISIDLTLTGLTGYQLAPDKSLATLPFALITVAGAVTTWFASFLLQRWGRRAGFVLGAMTCGAGGLVSVWAVFHANFWLFCAGTAAVGVFQAFAQYYRLAAADAVPNADKSRAISLVLAGGVVAAILGPALANWAKDLFPAVLFAGAYLMVALLGFISAAILWTGYRDGPDPHAASAPASATAGGLASPGTASPAQRPLARIARQPVFVAAIANNVVGSVSMMAVMTAAPLAAVACSHTMDQGAGIIQWHLVGMYAPSFFAGALIARFGLPAVLYAGMALNVISALAAMASTSLDAFYVSLFALGVGWNFMFVGGTTLLARSYRPAERAATQGCAELLRYVATALATLAAGPVLERFGWFTLNAAMLPVVALAAAMTLWWHLKTPRME
ncbi:MFS transporter [Bordetella genomosp. 9]|uniref:MFS transporter n=1 Tax=Bordetella genomosp. 9 TaxID=1416803 RepID=A0A261RL95_9BORD|nr:MFS transporter [Bordetella genomosp. 9]OZI25824.1 MFS transporter [Bordetella genomosp. 9]